MKFLINLIEKNFRCYGVGLQLSQSSCQLWHDLGLNLYFQGCCDVEKSTDLFNRSILSLKKSLTFDSCNHEVWNSLGIVAANKSKDSSFFV